MRLRVFRGGIRGAAFQLCVEPTFLCPLTQRSSSFLVTPRAGSTGGRMSSHDAPENARGQAGPRLSSDSASSFNSYRAPAISVPGIRHAMIRSCSFGLACRAVGGMSESEGTNPSTRGIIGKRTTHVRSNRYLPDRAQCFSHNEVQVTRTFPCCQRTGRGERAMKERVSDQARVGGITSTNKVKTARPCRAAGRRWAPTPSAREPHIAPLNPALQQGSAREAAVWGRKVSINQMPKYATADCDRGVCPVSISDEPFPTQHRADVEFCFIVRFLCLLKSWANHGAAEEMRTAPIPWP